MKKTFNEENAFSEYIDIFIQRIPRYTVKLKNKASWRTKNKLLVDTPIKAHLDQKYIIGTLGKWYPPFAILDIDDKFLEDVDKIKDMLGLDAFNSMLCSSESANSYHILIRPTYNNKPPTIRLLQNTFKSFGKQNNIEIYPQSNRTIRSPFGYKQFCLDFEYKNLPNWWDKLYWFKRLDNFDISTVPYYQRKLDLAFKDPELPNFYEEGKLLFQYGLQRPNSRNKSQFKVLCYLWRINIPMDEAEKLTLLVIKIKHNGFSKEVNKGNWRTIKGEINRQANKIYTTYELTSIYPDETHNDYNGYLTKADIKPIVMISKGSLPGMKFLYHLVKHCYPRRHRAFINIHSDKLIEWSSRGTYPKRLDELKKKGIIKRGDSYSVDRFSKSIKINWDFKDIREAILNDNRSPNTLEDTIKLSYEPEEIKALLKKAGVKRTTAIEIIKKIY